MPPPPQIVVVGSVNLDLVCTVERLPAPGETVGSRLMTGINQVPQSIVVPATVASQPGGSSIGSVVVGASPVVVGDEDSLDGMLSAVEEHPDRDLIIDLAAQSAQPINRWIEVANDRRLMTIAERQRMKVWLRHAYEQLEQVVGLGGESMQST